MKQRLLARLLVLSLVFFCLPAAAATETMPCLTLDETTVFIGDSNTVFLRYHNPEIQKARVFARVGGRIDECVKNYSRYHADRYNSSLYELIQALEGSSYSTVCINMGTNSVGFNLNTFRSNYQALLDLLYAKNPDAVYFVCKILPVNHAKVTGPYRDYFTNANINAINNVITELQAENAAAGRNVKLMDLNTPFRDAYGNLSSAWSDGGGIHLSPKGYRHLSEVVQRLMAQGSPFANHTWGDISVTEAPGCATEGKGLRCCQYCGAEQETAVPATGNHSWNAGKVTTKPTCTEPGVKTFTCTVCSQQKTEPVAANGHYWEVTEILSPATEDEHGTAKYTCKTCGATKEAVLCASEIFIDTPAEDHWAHTPIDWAFFGGITAGTKANLFSPDRICTREQVVTFLWRANGCPEPASTENPFTDVNETSYAFKAILWAVEKGITTGTSKTKFSPANTCTRDQVVTFLWRAKGCPEPETEENPFKDVSEGDYFYKAVLWAVENNVTYGTSKTKFSPANTCTRAQVVTFLYRAAQLLDPEPAPDPDPEPNPENP